MRRVAVRLLILASTVAAVGLVSRAEPTKEESGEAAGATDLSPKPDPKPLGISTCASTACHGNPNAPSLTAAPGRDCWQSSLTHFLAADPHRKAYDVLKSELSTRITAALRKSSRVSIPDAWNDSRCLACHTNPTLAPDTVPDDWKALRTEGVSCEACHGNAERWKGPHTAWTPLLRNSGASDNGFRDLNRMSIRAETCFGCHIGAPAGAGVAVRDMNHDMIAAGHPELNFEFEKHLARLPKHWLERDRHLKGPLADADSPGGVKIGALETLSKDRKARNETGDSRTPWPELSEQWACAKCHKELGSK